MQTIIRSPWAAEFDQLVRSADSSLVISSPYVSTEACQRLVDSLGDRAGEVQLLLVTDLSREQLLRGANDARAICDLACCVCRTEVRFLPSLHAKAYVADEDIAIVTSANMTGAGLLRNVEYGVKFTDPPMVRAIRRDVCGYAQLGTLLTPQRLQELAALALRLKAVRRQLERASSRRLQRLFSQELQAFDDELLRMRSAGRTAHAIFADAIVYLLARGPLRTADLHPLIKGIHPDLCDDNVDRVIDGRHFGRKWKHAVRTAQQHLKRQGLVELRGGLWTLTENGIEWNLASAIGLRPEQP